MFLTMFEKKPKHHINDASNGGFAGGLLAPVVAQPVANAGKGCSSIIAIF